MGPKSYNSKVPDVRNPWPQKIIARDITFKLDVIASKDKMKFNLA